MEIEQEDMYSCDDTRETFRLDPGVLMFQIFFFQPSHGYRPAYPPNRQAHIRVKKSFDIFLYV
jgi:hypothetical protein